MKTIILYLISALLSINAYTQCAGTISYTLDVPPSNDNTYPPGTTVELCVTMTGWDGNAQGSNWFEGFGLTLGSGWISSIPTLTPADNEADGSGTWLWVDNVTSSQTGLTVGPGFFFEGPQGPTDGDPGNDWGDYCSNGDCVWNFCVSLTADNVSGLPLTIEVTPYADGTMGSWTNPSCGNQDSPVSIFDGEIGCTTCGCIDPLACNFNPTACCDDGSCSYFSMGSITHNLLPCPDTTCTNSEVIYSVTGNQSSAYDWYMMGGGSVTTDQSNSCEVVWGNTPGTYTLVVQEITSAGCIGPVETCDVELVVPDIIFDTTEYNICLNSSVMLHAEPAGGYWFNEFMNGNIFIGEIAGLYQPEYYAMIHGCLVSETVDVNVQRKHNAPDIIYSDEVIDLCVDPASQCYVAVDPIGVVYFWSINDVEQPYIDNVLNIEWYDTTQTYTIKVIAYDALGCESEPKSISVRTESCQIFYAPNSFTPNGDGVNDVFIISGLSVYQPNLRIFNRWGVEVYTSSNLWWTGDSGGGYYSDSGVYNWIIEYKDKFGQNKQESGHLTLIR